MIFSPLRSLIGIHLGQKGLPPTIIAPVLRILELMDEEMIAIGFDFSNPEIDRQIQRLDEAIILWNHPSIEATIDGKEIELKDWVIDPTLENDPVYNKLKKIDEEHPNLIQFPPLFDSTAFLDDEEEDGN